MRGEIRANRANRANTLILCGNASPKFLSHHAGRESRATMFLRLNIRGRHYSYHRGFSHALSTTAFLRSKGSPHTHPAKMTEPKPSKKGYYLSPRPIADQLVAN